jgi:aspartate aminotransferase-like enzyme
LRALRILTARSESHVGGPFVECFGGVLQNLRKLFQTTDPASQPFVISGSGTLGWDQVASNLIEPGEEVLVLHTGYFADSFADCFETYGIKVTQLKAEIGDRPQLDEVEKALKERQYKMITVTHVDTSTGVLSEIEALSELVHRVSPDTLVVVDAVCSVGSENIRFDDWKLDCVLTASQKGIGCPAGLSIVMASGRAIERFKARKTRPTSYYGSWKNWLPSTLTSQLLRYSPLTSHSHAELRGEEAVLLCDPLPPAHPRPRHDPQADPLPPARAALRGPQGRLAEGQGSCQATWAQAARVQA